MSGGIPTLSYGGQKVPLFCYTNGKVTMLHAAVAAHVFLRISKFLALGRRVKNSSPTRDYVSQYQSRRDAGISIYYLGRFRRYRLNARIYDDIVPASCLAPDQRQDTENIIIAHLLRSEEGISHKLHTHHCLECFQHPRPWVGRNGPK